MLASAPPASRIANPLPAESLRFNQSVDRSSGRNCPRNLRSPPVLPCFGTGFSVGYRTGSVNSCGENRLKRERNWTEVSVRTGVGQQLGLNTTARTAPFSPPAGQENPLLNGSGGEGGIRTRGGCYTTHAFQACALNHSATSPRRVGGRRPRRRRKLYSRRGFANCWKTPLYEGKPAMLAFILAGRLVASANPQVTSGGGRAG